MPQSPDDAATPAPRLTAAQIVDYLKRHPTFLLRHPELLEVQAAPGRVKGEAVVDLQQFMVERLRKDLTRLRGLQDEMVANSRDNLSTQERIHKAALALLAAENFEHLIEIVGTDLAVLLDVDAAALCVEATADKNPRTVEGVQVLPAGHVDALLGANHDVLLRDDAEGDQAVFGPAAGLVRSDALIRLTISESVPAGLLAFGTRHPGYFNAGQGTELLTFLARVLEHCLRQWLGLKV
ncbi:MAG TPA: DUF484 family protein [Dongiaceae bacterium]|jgi:hypothetical protein|nr:DUF484 family protein [Dongiaceae bacterium]